MFQFFGPIIPKCTGPLLDLATGEKMCTFCDFLTLIDNLVKFMATLAPILATIFTIWGAFLMITSGGSPARWGQGKTAITRAVVGLIIVLCAWLIVSTVFQIIVGNYQGPLPMPWYKLGC